MDAYGSILDDSIDVTNPQGDIISGNTGVGTTTLVSHTGTIGSPTNPLDVLTINGTLTTDSAESADIRSLAIFALITCIPATETLHSAASETSKMQMLTR